MTAFFETIKTEKNLLSKKELLDIFVTHRVDSPFPGDWESIFKGTGYEFWALRELGPTDPFKNIDWKAKAKTGKYYVREYLADSYYNLMILYDISRSVSFGRKELLQANIAVSLAFTALVSNNGCGVIFFSDDVKAYIPPRMGLDHFMQIVSYIARVQPQSCPETNINSALTKLINELPESLSFILSDFMYPFECAYSFQRELHGTNRHEVKAFQILENHETVLETNSKGLITLFDYETGERMLVDLNKWRTFNAQMQRYLEETRHHLNKAGIDLLVITPEDDFRRTINSFMDQTYHYQG